MATVLADTFTQKDLKERIAHFVDRRRVPRSIRVITDTSDFFRVDYNDVVILDHTPYLVRNYEREGRFTIDEQPKFWVRRAIDLTDGRMKILKMVFLERFKSRIGGLTFDCIRSPRKEARILNMVRGHENFMQGFSTKDAAGNIIRIIDYIPGTKMDDYIESIGGNHEDYFYKTFPALFDIYRELVMAIKFLHDHGEKHGDIRRDHIIKDKGETQYRWIDFDFTYWHRENMFGYDLFGLGNVLIYLVGGEDVTCQYLKQHNPSAYGRLSHDDMNIIFTNRVANLQKVYPYIPDMLNRIGCHFSGGASVFYDNIDQLLNDLNEAREELPVYSHN